MLEFSGSRIVSTNMDFIYIVPCFFIPFFLASKLFRSNPTLQVPTFRMILQEFSNSDYFNDLSGWDAIYRNCILKPPANFMRASAAPDAAEVRLTERIKAT